MATKLSSLPSLLTGFQGGRKTAFALANLVAPNLLAGRRVITNIPILRPHFRRHLSGGNVGKWVMISNNLRVVSSEQIVADIPEANENGKIDAADGAVWQNAVIVIDEAGLMFGGLHSSDSRTKKMARFLAVARHINALVYLIGQTPEQIPPQLSGICAWHYHATNLDFRFGMKANRSRMSVYAGVCYSRTLKNVKLNPPISTFSFKPPAWIYSSYESVEPYIASADNRLTALTGSALWVVFLGIFLLGIVPLGVYSTLTFPDRVADDGLLGGAAVNTPAPVVRCQKKPRPDFVFCRDGKCIVRGGWE